MGDGKVMIKQSTFNAMDSGMFDLWIDLGARVINPIIRAGHLDADKFCELDDAELLAVPGISKAKFISIRKWMAENDWVWKGVEGIDQGAEWKPEWEEWAADQLRMRGWKVRAPRVKSQ